MATNGEKKVRKSRSQLWKEQGDTLKGVLAMRGKDVSSPYVNQSNNMTFRRNGKINPNANQRKASEQKMPAAFREDRLSDPNNRIWGKNANLSYGPGGATIIGMANDFDKAARGGSHG